MASSAEKRKFKVVYCMSTNITTKSIEYLLLLREILYILHWIINFPNLFMIYIGSEHLFQRATKTRYLKNTKRFLVMFYCFFGWSQPSTFLLYTSQNEKSSLEKNFMLKFMVFFYMMFISMFSALRQLLVSDWPSHHFCKRYFSAVNHTFKKI